MSIFVSVASYQDPTLERTLRQAIEQADKPNELIFAICLQYSEEPDISFIPESQKKIISFDPEARPGIVKVRNLLKEMYNNEDYFLQIDSHMQFDKSWDTILIRQFKELQKFANKDKVIISTPRDFPKQDGRGYSVLKVRSVVDQGFVTFFASNAIAPNTKEKFYKSNYVRCGMIFSDRQFANTIKFSKYNHAFEEEAYITFSSIISGWSIYELPYHTVIWHSPKEYLLKVLDPSKTRSFSGAYKDNDFERYEFSLAYIYNDYSKYKVDTAVMPASDFWNEIGLLAEYKIIKQKMDNIINNNFIL
jgi:hypothetical protein